jgi:hypothetical protein
MDWACPSGGLAAFLRIRFGCWPLAARGCFPSARSSGFLFANAPVGRGWLGDRQCVRFENPSTQGDVAEGEEHLIVAAIGAFPFLPAILSAAMPALKTNKHTDWLLDTGKNLRTSDGHTVKVWNFAHQPDQAVLSAWAQHIRRHYCADHEIDALRNGPGLSRAEFLRQIKLPDKVKDFGPGTRSGDFGELLVADFLEFVLGYQVPRVRYDRKNTRNESTKGCDVIGIRVANPMKASSKDALIVFECKVQLTGKKAKARLQDAIDDNGKDLERLAEGLNALRQRFLDRNDADNGALIERFQDMEDRPYTSEWGAAAIFDDTVFDSVEIAKSKAAGHPQRAALQLVVMKGREMMPLVHALYEAAADEA